MTTSESEPIEVDQEIAATVPSDAARLSKFEARGFFTADHAVVEGGKVYANGAYWSLLNFQTIPAVLQSAAVVAVVEVPFNAYQADHRLLITLVDSDDKELPFRVEGLFRTAPNLQARFGEPGLAPMAVPINGLSFERPGEYRFVLKIDDNPVASYRFGVRHQGMVRLDS